MMTRFAATRLIPSPPALVEMRKSRILGQFEGCDGVGDDLTDLWLVARLKNLHQSFLVSAGVEPSILQSRHQCTVGI